MPRPPTIPSTGAANAVVSKYGIGIRLWICAVPGRQVIAKVNAPKAMVPPIRRLGISSSRNNAAASGYTENATTNADTPPYSSTPQASTIAAIPCLAPNRWTKVRAMDRAQPESSINFPNSAPSRKIGKYLTANPPIAVMKTCV